ncbi:hypothetical protein WA026_016867 [Henosepilachna vigintioctopunctata]|uniref:Uncharacterized protein n=1 Tax=Henosepilachna vigintioctopunctata TaxID=420089 RepID=A0AAW1TZU9_9CUCU
MYLAFSNSTDLVVVSGVKENVKKPENCNGEYKCLQPPRSQVLKALNRLQNERKHHGKEQTKSQRKPRKPMCKDGLEKSSKIILKRKPCKPCKRGDKRKPKKHMLTSEIKASFQETFEHMPNENIDILEVTFQHEEFDLVEVDGTDLKNDNQYYSQ